MSTKLNRNAPCWCGSGKKYKNCHLRADEEKPRAPAPLSSPAPWTPPPLSEPKPLTPEEQEANAHWEQFEAANLNDKITLFLDTLAAGKLDAEESYEMLSGIRGASDTPHDAAARARYADLVERLRRDAPELYRHDLAYYHENLIRDVIADGRWDTLPELVTPLSEVADKSIDTFFDIVDLLLYYGKTDLLLDTMSRAWKKVSTSGNILPNGVDEYIGVLSNLVLYRYLETTPAPRADDPALHDAFKPYGKYRDDWLARAVPCLSAAAPSSWQPADFGEGVDAEQWENNVITLMFEFMADQRRRANVPYSKSNMAQFQLYDVLHQQFSEPAPSHGKKSRAPKSSLVPRREILDRTLAQRFHFLGAQPYKVGAAMELVPVYLHFCARIGAIHPVEMDDALTEIHPLSKQVCEILDKFSDTRLVQNVAAAWSDAALNALRDDPALAAARAQPIPGAPPPPPLPAARPGALLTHTFLVTYLAKPSITRKIEIAADQTLDDLHHAIQAAVNFDEDHLYSFYMSGKAWDETTEYSSPQGEGCSAASVKIRDLHLRMKQRFLYLFDYGDQHEFGVQLETINLDAPKGRYPKIVERHGKSPKQYPGSE